MVPANWLYSNPPWEGDFAMGGMHGYVRGKTKIATWLEFKKLYSRNRQPHGLHLDVPTTKRDAYRHMHRDPQTGEWVLCYHFGK